MISFPCMLSNLCVFSIILRKGHYNLKILEIRDKYDDLKDK